MLATPQITASIVITIIGMGFYLILAFIVILFWFAFLMFFIAAGVYAIGLYGYY